MYPLSLPDCLVVLIYVTMFDYLPLFLLKVEEAIAIAMAQKRRPIIVKSHMGMNPSLENLSLPFMTIK